MEKTVLITGGSSGIGRALVTAFSEEGYRVWFTYRTGKERARELLAQLKTGGARAFPLELGNRASHDRLLAELPGPVGVLVNNAGLGSKTVEGVSSDVHEQDAALMMVNAVGSLWLVRDLLPAMLERGFGKIIILSSVCGGVSTFAGFHVADGMSNAARAYMGRHLQAQYGHTPIDVFTICPGAVETPMFEASTLAPLAGAAREQLIHSLPGRRLIDPAEIGRLAVWLCREEARVLRGAVLDASLGLGCNPGALKKPSLQQPPATAD
jgi:NAD(P)-dependent dehydrogenase (short-subunit alcohol dehydrogenase family)